MSAWVIGELLLVLSGDSPAAWAWFKAWFGSRRWPTRRENDTVVIRP